MPDFIMPGAEPYFARGGPSGVLLLHGFSATPNEVLWLAQHLAGQGHTVYAARTAGHGTHYRDLARSRWTDWVATVLDGVHILRGQCDRVILAGMSIGGTLALFTASQIAVDGVIAMAAPIAPFPNLTRRRLAIAKVLRPFSDQTDRTPFAEYVLEQQKLRGDPPLGRVRYNIWSAVAVEQLTLLMAQTRENLRKITAPVLAIYSKSDATVLPHHLDALREELTGAKSVEAHLLEKSSHILTQDKERETVFRLAAEFVASMQTA